MKRICLLISLAFALAATYSASDQQFVFTNFTGAGFTLDGTATVMPDGPLQLCSGSSPMKGHAFYPTPLSFRVAPNNTVQSFSVAFVSGIIPDSSNHSAHGMAFFIAASTNFSAALPGQYLGLLDAENNGNTSNHLFAIELDTVLNIEFEDINYNHVGIDINSLESIASYTPLSLNDTHYEQIPLISHEAIQVWVDYDGRTNKIEVRVARLGQPRPELPVTQATYDLSTVLTEPAYVGFSAATGWNGHTRHYVLGWSFGIGRSAPDIDLTKLPQLPNTVELWAHHSKVKVIVLITITCFFLTIGTIILVLLAVRRRRRLLYTDHLEDWETEFGPHRFLYKDLIHATEGFTEKHLIGRGGFGQVYRGVLPVSRTELAVKRVSHESRQGMREFIAEIASIGRLRHRNIVQLLGYCRQRKGELILVYEYMPNGSLDRHLYAGAGDISSGTACMGWAERFHVIKGIASGLLYLHEYWEQVVIHRDVKTSNVLLDGTMSGRLGDFGLARLYNHGTDPQTTRMAGTFGYLAPELARTGKASPLTDVFAFGVVLLEVTCGRRPIEGRSEQDAPFILVDWVTEHWHNGSLVAAVDGRLQDDYNPDEALLALKLGLWCTHPSPAARPIMQQVVMCLEGDHSVPEFVPAEATCEAGFDFLMTSHQESSVGTMSGLSGGR